MIFPPRSIAIEPSEAVDVGKAAQQATIEVGGEKVAKENMRVRPFERFGADNRIDRAFEDRPELLIQRGRLQNARHFTRRGLLHFALLQSVSI